MALRNVSAFYTYSKSRGLFAGISIEGACFVERKGANRKIYGGDVRARDLLSGRYPQPPEAATLYVALREVMMAQARAAAGQALEQFGIAMCACGWADACWVASRLRFILPRGGFSERV